MSIPPISSRAPIPRFGVEKPAEPGNALVKADLSYSREAFDQQMRAYITHLDTMPAGDRAGIARWLIQQNLYLSRDNAGFRMQGMSNRDFVKYLAIANFFLRAEQAELFSTTLRESRGFWARLRYPARARKLGQMAGLSHEYRKYVARAYEADPQARQADWTDFRLGKIPHDRPMSFPIRYDNPRA